MTLSNQTSRCICKCIRILTHCLDPICLTLRWFFLKYLFEKVDFEKMSVDDKPRDSTSALKALHLIFCIYYIFYCSFLCVDYGPIVLLQIFFSYLIFYYIPINDISFELSVFWPSDTESLINELRFSDSISLSFKMRLMSVTCFYCNVT